MLLHKDVCRENAPGAHGVTTRVEGWSVGRGRLIWNPDEGGGIDLLVPDWVGVRTGRYSIFPALVLPTCLKNSGNLNMASTHPAHVHIRSVAS